MGVYQILLLRKQLLLRTIIFLAIMLFIIVAKALYLQELPGTPEKFNSKNFCDVSTRYHAAKPLFSYLCETDPNFMENSVDQGGHICEKLYSGREKCNLFARLHSEFHTFSKVKILYEDIENISISCPMCHHVQIIGNELYHVPRPVARNLGVRSRSVKMHLKHVLTTFPTIPDMDLFFTIEDIVDLGDKLNSVPFKVPIFGLVKSMRSKRGLRADRVILMPCFSLWSWPEARAGKWSKKSRSVLDASLKLDYHKRIPKLFWRGFDWANRKWLINVAKKFMDTMDVEVNRFKIIQNQLARVPSDTFKTLEQHCNYKYLLHMEGYSFSARLKYLLLCGSTVVFSRNEYWEEYWYHLLENDKNIIFFDEDGNEAKLNETLHFLRSQENKAKEIGDRGRYLIQHYLNEHAVTCYWWKLLDEYAKLLDYKPSLHPDAIPIDEFILGTSF